jgi:DNA invertase Pin-like site-specific DNA recombinase
MTRFKMIPAEFCPLSAEAVWWMRKIQWSRKRPYSGRASGTLAPVSTRPKVRPTSHPEIKSFARKGDTVVWKLDRLGRSLRHLVETLAALRERGIGFRSLRERIDTTTSGGKLVFHVGFP